MILGGLGITEMLVLAALVVGLFVGGGLVALLVRWARGKSGPPKKT